MFKYLKNILILRGKKIARNSYLHNRNDQGFIFLFFVDWERFWRSLHWVKIFFMFMIALQKIAELFVFVPIS